MEHQDIVQFVFKYAIHLTFSVSFLFPFSAVKYLDKINLGWNGLLGLQFSVIVHLYREVHLMRPGVSPSQAVMMGPQWFHRL